MFKLSGYPGSSTDPNKMSKLSDLSITASPQVLRLLAKFLQGLADEIETGRLRNSHVHIDSCIPEWRELGNGIDIQVMNTNYEGPALM